MNKIKVLHYVPGFKDGGIESRLLDWYSNIDKQKIEFIVIKLNNIDDSDKIKKFVELGGKYYNLPPFRPKNFIKYIKMLKSILKKEKPDVLHVHSLSTGIFPLFYGKKYNIQKRILHSRTNSYLPNEKNKLFKKILKSITPLYATDFFACSIEAGIWGIGKKYKDRINVINNGISLEKYIYRDDIRKSIRKEYNIKDEEILIGTVGRLSPQKNLFFLLEIFEKISKKNKLYKLMIVGDGSLKKELIEKAKELKIENKIMFIGAKNDVWNYYMCFDAFLGTSFYEGFGTTAIEAQASGLNTFLSEGFPEVVKVTDHAYRFPLSISANEWAEQIQNIKVRKRKKTDTIEIENAGYSANSVAKKLERIYISSKEKQ